VTVVQSIDHWSFRHWGGYIFGGLTAFAVDFAVIEVAHYGFGIDPFWSNVIGLCVATVVAWLLHRRITFNVPYPPSLREFVRFFVIAWAANGVSLAANTLILWAAPAAPIEAAFLISRGFGGASAYIGFRFGVFRHFREA
jgi:putative flippase GtrA